MLSFHGLATSKKTCKRTFRVPQPQYERLTQLNASGTTSAVRLCDPQADDGFHARIEALPTHKHSATCLRSTFTMHEFIARSPEKSLAFVSVLKEL